MKINNLFHYPALERVTAEDGKRFYVDPNGNKLSSVTTILSATSHKPELEAWRAWVGEAKANKIRDEATGLGSLMHEHLENHLLNVERPRGSNLVRQMARNMADQIINKGLVNVDEVWGIEAPLYMPERYAGTADLIGVYKGQPALMDFKTTNKMKTADMIEDYFQQCAAYADAHNHLYGTQIETIVIFMASRDLDYREFVIQGDDFHKHLASWKSRVDQFQAAQSAGSITSP